MDLAEMYLETFLNSCVGIVIYGFELAGVFFIAAAGVQGLINYVKKDPAMRLHMAHGMALGMEFKLGSEILRTVIVREFAEIVFVAAIIAVRAALTFLIQWEIRTEQENKRRS